MGVWLMAAFCFIFITAAVAWEVITESGHIEALLGEDVTLPCLLSGITPPMDLRMVGVYWTRKSQNGTMNKVYQFEGYNHTQIRSGSNMADSDLLLGNASLYLPRVQISDEGQYRCRVIFTPDDGETSYTLLVTGKPNVTLTDSVSVLVGNEKSVTCSLAQFYPNTVNIQWIKRSKLTRTNTSLDGDTYFTKQNKNSDGTFNVGSLLTVRPNSTEETGDEYFCIVSHRSLKTNIESSFTLTITEHGASPAASGVIITLQIVLGAVIITATVMYHAIKSDLSLIRCVLRVEFAIFIPALTLFLLIIFRVELHLGAVSYSLHFILLVLLAIQALRQYFSEGGVTVSSISGDDYIIHMERTTLYYEINAKPAYTKVNIYIKRRDGIPKQCILSCRYEKPTIKCYDKAIESPEGIPLNSVLPPIRMEAKIEKWGNYCRCSINVTLDAETDEEMELTVEATHPALIWPLSTKQTLRAVRIIRGIIKMKTQFQQGSDGNSKRICRVEGLHPDNVIITWKRNNPNQLVAVCCFQKNYYTAIGMQHHIENITSDPVSFSSVLDIKMSSIHWYETQFFCIIEDAKRGIRREQSIRSIRTDTGVPEMTMIIDQGGERDDVRIICNVKGPHPDNLMIAWKKDNRTEDLLARCCFQNNFYSAPGIQHHIEDITTSSDPVSFSSFSSVLTFNNSPHQWNGTHFQCIIEDPKRGTSNKASTTFTLKDKRKRCVKCLL